MTDLLPAAEPFVDPFPMPSAEQIEVLRGSETLNAFTPVARAINAANGWAPEFSFHQTPVFIALIDSEINEARDEWMVHQMHAYLYELGDVIIRAMDLAELLAPGALAQEDLSPGEYFPEESEEFRLLELYGCSAKALQAYRKVPDWDEAHREVVRHLVVQIRLAHTMIVNRENLAYAPFVVTDLLQANRVRGQRHGGRRC